MLGWERELFCFVLFVLFVCVCRHRWKEESIWFFFFSSLLTVIPQKHRSTQGENIQYLPSRGLGTGYLLIVVGELTYLLYRGSSHTFVVV